MAVIVGISAGNVEFFLACGNVYTEYKIQA
jgi:hypothetical protein